MMARRKWRPPNNPTGPAKQVWKALFPGHPWPKGWTVHWAGFMRGALALTLFGRRGHTLAEGGGKILLSYGDHAGPVMRRRRDPCPGAGNTPPLHDLRPGAIETLLHEFVHVRSPWLRHGKEFRGLENALRARLGFEPEEGGYTT